ncbi:MAG: hypothetical protein PHQ35_08065 [Phycisphaerae bacterium]|nr:hypothetical protein [Phycisphaerae bacterium]MDD5380117.1 hypothetical protein [Phycisphaerae bacterium]
MKVTKFQIFGAMFLGNLIFGFITGVGWFFLSRVLGYKVAGLILFLSWTAMAVIKLLNSQDKGVLEIHGSGAFEMIAANTSQILGITTLGFWGGIAGYVLYMFTMEVLVLFRARIHQVGSTLGAAINFLKNEIPMLLLIGLLCYIFVFVAHLKFPKLLTIGATSTFMDYIRLCVSYFLWIAFGSGIVAAYFYRPESE